MGAVFSLKKALQLWARLHWDSLRPAISFAAAAYDVCLCSPSYSVACRLGTKPQSKWGNGYAPSCIDLWSVFGEQTLVFPSRFTISVSATSQTGVVTADPNSTYTFIHIYIMCVYLSIYPSIHPSIYLSIYLSYLIYFILSYLILSYLTLSIYLSIYLSL